MSVTRIHVPSKQCKIEITSGQCRANTAMFRETRQLGWPEQLVDDALAAMLRSDRITEEIKNDVVNCISERHLGVPHTEHNVQFFVDDILVNLYSRDGYWRIGGHWPYELERSNNMCLSFTQFIVALANVQRGYEGEETYNVRFI